MTCGRTGSAFPTARRIGCQVELAENSSEALERLRAGMPDIVFMDIRMPGMGDPRSRGASSKSSARPRETGGHLGVRAGA